jgi:hypothetical protein
MENVPILNIIELNEVVPGIKHAHGHHDLLLRGCEFLSARKHVAIWNGMDA